VQYLMLISFMPYCVHPIQYLQLDRGGFAGQRDLYPLLGQLKGHAAMILLTRPLDLFGLGGT